MGANSTLAAHYFIIFQFQTLQRNVKLKWYQHAEQVRWLKGGVLAPCLPAGGGTVRCRRSTVERNQFKTAAGSLLLLLLFFCPSLVMRVQLLPLLPADEHWRYMLKRSAKRWKRGLWHFRTCFLACGLKNTEQTKTCPLLLSHSCICQTN